jgi:pilus assembly protein CpaC
MSWLIKIWAKSLFAVVAVALLSHDVLAQEIPQYTTPENATMPIAVSAMGNAPVQLDVGQNRAHAFTLDEPVSKIVVGNEAVADVHVDGSNPAQVFVVPRAIGATNVFFMDDNGEIIEQLEIRVTMNDSALRDALKKLLPNENIGVDIYQDSVFLSGNVSSAASVDDAVRIAMRFVADETFVTNMLKVTGSQQVILQVRVTEMDRGTLKQLTADLASSAIGSTRALAFTTAPSAITSPFVTATLTRPFAFDKLGTVTFEALETQSLVKTLAEPTLIAMSGETASFNSGGQIAVVTGFDDQGNSVIEYVDFGVGLDFTPVVVSRGNINLHISTNISAIDSTLAQTIDGNSVAGFSQKRTETTVSLQSGGSLMLSGLIEDNVSDSISGFPFLKDIPILGALFRSTSFQKDETELVVTVTAYLAEPTDNSRPLQVPTDGFEPASDIDVYLLGRLHRRYGVGERPFWTDSVEGPFGYLMK